MKDKLPGRLVKPDKDDEPPACAYCDSDIKDEEWYWLSSWKYRSVHYSCYKSAKEVRE